MSLRASLILGIALVLTTSLICDGVLVYWHAVNKVDTEIRAALAVGRRTMLDAVSVRRDGTPLPDYVALMRSLDGDRHLRATLLAEHGEVLARSSPLPAGEPAPEWFYRLLLRPPAVSRISVPLGGGAPGSIVLETDAHNEISEAWSDAILTFGILVLFCCLNSVSVYWIVGYALKPLNALVTAFRRVGAGDYDLQALERGPRELAQLSRRFNEMVLRLAEMSQRKERLEQQLVEVQEEERAEVARELHDEIGPLLFAVGVDLAALQGSDALGRDAQLQARLMAASGAVASLEHKLSSMLGRLRPATGGLGMRRSFERLAAVLSVRTPPVCF